MNSRFVRMIVRECLDEEGFLVRLHSLAEFDQDRFRILMEHIEAYARETGESDVIHRSVASCLFELFAALTTAIDAFSEMDHPDLSKVREAHGRLADVLHGEIFRLSPE